MKNKKIKADLKPHHLTENAWYYRERKYFDVYVHSAPGIVLNFRIPYSQALDRA